MSLLPQFGFIELLVVAVVALIVVGPKDLPMLMRKCGKMVAQAKRMAGEFTSAFDQMARDAEMDELREEMEALKKANPIAEIKDEVDLAFKPVGKAVKETIDEGQALHDQDNLADEDLPVGMSPFDDDAPDHDALLDDAQLDEALPGDQPIPDKPASPSTSG